MTFTEIKLCISKEIGLQLGSLSFYQQFDLPTVEQIAAARAANPNVLDKDIAGNPQPWVRSWIKDQRIAVVMHMEVFDSIIADRSIDTLAMKDAVLVKPKSGSEETYTRYVVFIPTNVLGVL